MKHQCNIRSLLTKHPTVVLMLHEGVLRMSNYAETGLALCTFPYQKSEDSAMTAESYLTH